ncbi:uncharacterized protein LOC126803500 [Argentina anserina]|uniref:uncharacterized protein LOC126803500 n=1 Tax=Argentina anserina TaxID=57926 RepID=UPI00217677BE|nr:uncharacterized protein LOC126803500 [Potentilla anserina]
MNRLRKLLKKEEEDSITRNRQRALVMQVATSEIQRIQEEESQWGVSREGRRYIPIEREDMDQRLKALYFTSPCRFQGDIFCRRYRMRPYLFDQMMHEVANHNPYFVQMRDTSGRVGFSVEQKLTCAMRMLAYGLIEDLCDEVLDIVESSAMEILQHFTKAIWNVYHKHYLCRSLPADLQWLLNMVDKRGFPGMVGSLEFNAIYPKWGNFLKAMRNPITPQQAHFTKMQESFRKHVERTFEILLARFAIVRGPNRGWAREDLLYIMMTCIILHNIIVEDECEEEEDMVIDRDEITTMPRAAKVYDMYDNDHQVEHNISALMNCCIDTKGLDIQLCIIISKKIWLNTYGM